MIAILLCVAVAVFYGLCLLLLLAGVEWLLGKIPPAAITLSPEIKHILQALVGVAVFIWLVMCVFGEGGGRGFAAPCLFGKCP